MSKHNALKATESSGNRFADLGFADPDLEILKSAMVHRIAGIIGSRKLTPAHACRHSRSGPTLAKEGSG